MENYPIRTLTMSGTKHSMGYYLEQANDMISRDPKQIISQLIKLQADILYLKDLCSSLEDKNNEGY